MNSLRLRVMCIAWAAWLMACAGGAANSTVNPEYERTAFETEAGGLTSGLDFSVSRGREDITSFRAEMAGGKLKSNIADLAVVQLGRPAEGIKIDFQFPAQEVSIDEKLTVVGFGETRHRGKDEGTRRVGHNAVTDIVLSSGGTGSFLFRAPGAHTHAGDSGGPCFRETPAGRWLVGINSGHANGGTVSWFTSTFHFRTWIAEQLRKGDTD